MHFNMSIFRTAKYAFLLLFLACTLVSGMSVTQNITVDIDGGAVVNCIYIVPVKSLWLCREMNRRMGITDFTSRQAVLRHFESAPGIKLESHFSAIRGENSITQFTLSLDDVSAALKTGLFGGLAISKSDKIAGDLVFTAKIAGSGKPTGEMAELLELLGGMDLTLRLATPTEIIESSGRKEAFNRHSWQLRTEDILSGKFPEIKARW